jgi:hypothetical protein
MEVLTQWTDLYKKIGELQPGLCVSNTHPDYDKRINEVEAYRKEISVLFRDNEWLVSISQIIFLHSDKI